MISHSPASIQAGLPKTHNKPVKAISFEVRIKSHSDTVIVEKEYITFDGNKKESSKDVDFTVPSKIQAIKGVVVEYRIVKNEDGNWIPKYDWKEDATAKPKENIWITLDEPEDPLGEHGKDKVRTGMLEIACDLDNVTIPEEEKLKITNARSSPTVLDIINTTLVRVHDYLEIKGFVYNGKITHTGDGTMTTPNGEKVTGNIFRYTEFIKQAGTAKFQGDCQDVSDLYVLCCCALGIDIRLQRITFGANQTAVLQSNAKPINYSGEPLVFGMHQFGIYENLIYDPLIVLKQGGSKFYMKGIFPGDYLGTKRDDYIDLVFAVINTPEGGIPTVIWSQEFPLLIDLQK